MKGRNAGLLRALALAHRLKRAKAAPPLSSLAQEFGVHPRTIRRDIYALEETGWIKPGFPFYPSDRWTA